MTRADAPEPPDEDESTEGDDSTARVELDVPDMDCASCANKVEAGVESVDGVESIETSPASGRVAVTYDRASTSTADVTGGVEAAGYDVEASSVARATFDVPDMDCASCANKVEAALDGQPGIRRIQTSPTSGRVSVEYDDTDADELRAAIESAGYDVTGSDADAADASGDDRTDQADRSVWASARAKKTYVGAGLLAFALVAEFALGGLATVATVLGAPLTVADVGFLGATALAGQAILRGGYYSAKNRQLDIDFLMSAAIVAAVTASLGFGEHLYFEAATLAVLFSVSELLEGYAMDRTRNSLQELVELSPDEATVKHDDGSTTTVEVDALDVGDVVVVKPGEKVPADGVVVEGDTAINQAPVTGESVPVDKTVGDEVYAGTINEAGYVEVEVRAKAADSTLSRIVSLVEDAEANQTEREQFVERFAGYYTPVMVALAIAVAVVPPVAFGAPWTEWFVNGITMLVLACPCAFVISTPVSVVSGVTSAARNGVLVKGGNHLEAMGEVDAVAVDKTGTLTKGELAVTDVVPLGDRTEADVLRCARGLEARSEHPIADAIVAHADGTDGVGAPATEVDGFEAVTGKGVTGALHGTEHYAGKPAWFDDLGFELGHAHVVDAGTNDAGTNDTVTDGAGTDVGGTDGGAGDDHGVPADVTDLCERQGCLNLAEDTIPRLQGEGKTVILVGTEDELEGLVAVADEVRPGAKQAVAALQRFGLEVVMLTGDNEGTARAVAEAVGVDDYRAGLLPEDKVDAVSELDAEYDGGVAMVGDGVNDAPALATATVGVAMGAAGTDTAIETADIALMSDDVRKLPYLYDLSHRANGVIRQNIFASLAVKAVLAVGVAVPYVNVSVALAVLAGDAGMTLGVTGNALRLGRIRPEL
ncbi:heavy metal translocating P-type ATPase [Halorubellus sp. JP-L1]|uniref:heavy metal translocating P-type ATPase n=1 Tax=Halorubellus sp. JP-L1 TaxID=2715753 RepID=UPI001408AB86|nr:heavy metal translocating P-type ATPase [Halorubellus sp. JP-L1]NHN43255.1 heavy metal translocating P-type ATPase [Halorubellus sp. JP-L1]